MAWNRHGLPSAMFPMSSPWNFGPHPSIPPVVQYQSQSSNIALGGIEEHDGIIGSGEKIPWFYHVLTWFNQRISENKWTNVWLFDSQSYFGWSENRVPQHHPHLWLRTSCFPMKIATWAVYPTFTTKVFFNAQGHSYIHGFFFGNCGSHLTGKQCAYFFGSSTYHTIH